MSLDKADMSCEDRQPSEQNGVGSECFSDERVLLSQSLRLVLNNININASSHESWDCSSAIRFWVSLLLYLRLTDVNIVKLKTKK